MTSEQREILRRILTSRQFASADSLKRILEYLCSRADDSEQGTLKEYDIAIHALGRPHSFDPKTDPIVRVNIASIRERLHSFFDTEAGTLPYRLAIPKGQYRAVFEEVRCDATKTLARTSGALQQFWRPYLDNLFPNIVVFTELLFFRDDRGNFVRNIYVNDVNTGLDHLKERFQGTLTSPTMNPSFHFVSSGELQCLLSLSRMFGLLGAHYETKNSRFVSWNLLRESNLIFLGSARTNPFVDSLQGDNKFALTADTIVNTRPAPGEPECYAGSRYRDGKLEKVTEYAVVTRRPGVRAGCATTVISAQSWPRH